MSQPNIPYGKQSIDRSDLDAVAEVLFSPMLTTGPAVDAFEQAVADYVGAKFAVAFSSATAGLHGACFAADLGPGDRVATSPLTFMASANCARYVGASPVLVDIDESTWNLDVSKVDASLDALVAVHYAGLPVTLESLAHRPRVVIEDASHALGAHTPDGRIGNCAHSDMAVFSFHPVKPITTGEGGMVTTNDAELARRLRRFRSHGIDRTPTEDGWYYDAVELGFNYRMTDIHAALGSSQLRRLDQLIARRNDLASRYRELLAELPIILPPAASPGTLHGYHLFAVRVPNRAEVYRAMHARGIGVQVHYVPIHHHSISSDIAVPPEGFPVADAVYEGLISLPMYPDLTQDQQLTVVEALRESLSA